MDELLKEEIEVIRSEENAVKDSGVDKVVDTPNPDNSDLKSVDSDVSDDEGSGCEASTATADESGGRVD
jgi:hypothetical protein